jgi:hypothetical protein
MVMKSWALRSIIQLDDSVVKYVGALGFSSLMSLGKCSISLPPTVMDRYVYRIDLIGL